VTALLYGGLSLAVWRAYDRHSVAGPAASLAPGNTLWSTSAQTAAVTSSLNKRVLQAVLFLAIIAHGILLHATIFPADSMVFGFALSLSAMLWLGAGIYLIESFFFRLDGLGLLVLPLAGLGALMPALFRGVKVMSYAAAPLFKIHFLIANIAYGLLTIAALHAFLMLLVERRLHASKQRMARGANAAGAARAMHIAPDTGWLASWLETLPPLLTMEKLLFRLISAGFVMLTLTLVTGILFSEQLLDQLLRFDHKTVFAILSWLMFGGLVVGRRIYGWRGRAALRWVLFSFLALLLAYVGSRFVLEVLLHRPVV